MRSDTFCMLLLLVLCVLFSVVDGVVPLKCKSIFRCSASCASLPHAVSSKWIGKSAISQGVFPLESLHEYRKVSWFCTGDNICPPLRQLPPFCSVHTLVFCVLHLAFPLPAEGHLSGARWVPLASMQAKAASLPYHSLRFPVLNDSERYLLMSSCT